MPTTRSMSAAQAAATITTSPPSSLAASLPPEILSQIFKLAVSYWDSRNRVEIALVCRSWWYASNVWCAYLIRDPWGADQIAARLQEINKGDVVHGLNLVYDIEDDEVPKSFGSLIRLCPNIRVLRLVPTAEEGYFGEIETLIEGQDDEFIDALTTLKEVESFTLFPRVPMEWARRSFDRILSSWTKLREITLFNTDMIFQGGSDGSTLPTGVVNLFWSKLGAATGVIDLITKSHSSMRSIWASDLFFPQTYAEPLQNALKAAAPQLLELVLLDIRWEWSATERKPLLNFHELAPLLKNLRQLRLAVTCVDPATIFELVATLPLLESFKLGNDKNQDVSKELASLFQLSALVNLFSRVSASSSLKSVTLSRWTELEWFGEAGGSSAGLKELKEAGQKVGVDFDFI